MSMKLLFDFDEKHEYLVFFIENIWKIIKEQELKCNILSFTREKASSILKDSEYLDRFNLKYYSKIRRQIVFQYYQSKNKTLLPLYFVFNFLLDEFKNDEILDMSENNNTKWNDFLTELSKFYCEEEIIEKINNPLNHIEDNKIIETLNNQYLAQYKFTTRNGVVDLNQRTVKAVVKHMEAQIRKLGGLAFIDNIFNSLSKLYYSNEHHRYVFSIGTQKIGDMPESEYPWNFLILLGAKNINHKPKTKLSDENSVYKEILNTAKSLVSLYDLEQFTNVKRLINRAFFDEDTLYKQVLYSYLYRFQQCDRVFFEKIVNKLFCFSSKVQNGFRDMLGFSLDEYTSLIKKIINNAPDTGIYKIDKHLFNNELTIIDNLAHKDEICRYYLTPIDFDKMQNNVIMRPFVKSADDYYFIDCSYSLWNFYNVLFILFENNNSIKNSISETIGKNIETILQEECVNRGYTIHYGKYKNSEFECDLVIETQKSVIFIECKKKEFTMQSLAGDRYKLLDDYIKAVIEPHAQCLEHAAFLHKNKKIEFVNPKSVLNLQNRKILRISLGLFDTYALNEHYSIMRGLEFFANKRYSYSFSPKVPESVIKNKTEQFEKSNRKLESINKNFSELIKDDDTNKSEKDKIEREEKMNSWNISLEHFLFLLDKGIEDSKELDDELEFMKNIMTCSSDLYLEYEKSRKLKE